MKISIKELEQLMFQATETWNMNADEKHFVPMTDGIKMFIKRLIIQFQNEKK